jgi:Fe-S cluster assembly protein SufB
VQVLEGAHHAKCNVECDALLLDEDAKTDTYPYIEINEKAGHHRARSAREQGQRRANLLPAEPRTQERRGAHADCIGLYRAAGESSSRWSTPVELNRLIELEMEGSVG